MAILLKQTSATHAATTPEAKKVNVDFLAIGIALVLAALIRLDLIPQIKW